MKKNNSTRKVIGFVISSLTTGALYAALLFLFDSIIKLPFVISVSIAYISAIAFYFTTNKMLVFKTLPEKNVVAREVIRFILLIIFNYCITLGIVFLIKQFTGEIYSGSLIAGVITILLTYFVFNRFIFVIKSPKN